MSFLSVLSLSGQKPDSTLCRSAGPEDFLTMIRFDKKVILCDVRLTFEYRSGHIENARHLPAGRRIERASENWEKGAVVLLYCKTGVRSCRQAKILTDKGFTNVWSLEGGIDAWKLKGLPVIARKRFE
jgi:rhodanese-related sulfurtransferase